MVAISSKPLPYTSDPLKLLLGELSLFASCSFPTPWNYLGLPSIVWPLWGWPSGPLDEIYPFSFGNVWATLCHGILCVLQTIFIVGVPTSGLIGVPFPPLLCTPVFIVTFVAFIVINKLVCDLLLNGSSKRIFYSAGPGGVFAEDASNPNTRLISKDPNHAGERWVFINGVAVGSHWLQTNLDRLAATFRRPILGIHNATCGIPFDVLECMIQRTFCYPTDDIRTEYAQIVKILSDPKVSKLVLIAHSQGAIEAGMVLDWLYSTVSTDEMQKLELYTFGNASNHWNCPLRDRGPAVKHIEHYANEWDWVSRFGILHFRPLSIEATRQSQLPAMNGAASNNGPQVARVTTTAERQSTSDLEAKLAAPHRFTGRLFLRTNAPGHQFNQHYLDNMFPMSLRKGKLDKVTDATSNFMNMEVDEQALLDDDTVKPNLPGGRGEGRKIKSFSRLWKYVNGGVPDDGTDERLRQEATSPIATTPASIRGQSPLPLTGMRQRVLR